MAADGSVGVDFDLPRFGVSLVTIQPSAVAIDGGTATDGSAGIGGDSGNRGGNGGSGCGCRVGGRGDGAANSATALLGVVAMVIVVVVRRRRSAKCADRT